MKRNRDEIRSAVWILAVVLLVVAMIGALAVMDLQGRSRDGITLPDPESDSVDPIDTQPAEAFATVTPENAPALVRAMARPARYHQTLRIETLSDERVGTQTVEIWFSDGVWKIQRAEGDQVRHILTDGRSASVWYGDDSRSVRTIELPEDLSPDDLTGIPTYETLAELPPDTVAAARYEAPEALGGAPCLYVETTGGTISRYWVDLSTGLLRSTEILHAQEPILRIEQTALELPDAEDAALARAMRLPNGQTPSFIAAEETPQS